MISVCAICGDEQLCFEPWIKHLKRVPQVKEINVLYNKEKPLSIHGVNYRHCRNHYNFSEWRNQSLAMAEEEWILVLDIDEFLSYGFIEEIGSLLAQDCDFIKARRIDFWDKNNYRKDLKYQKYYLFKNKDSIFFTRPLHEELCVKHGDNVEDIHSIRLIEDSVKVIQAKNPVYHYSLVKSFNKGTEKRALYKTIRYINDWNCDKDNIMNVFDKKKLIEHIERESQKGLILEEFKEKHPEELREIL